MSIGFWGGVGLVVAGLAIGAGGCYLALAIYFSRNNPWG